MTAGVGDTLYLRFDPNGVCGIPKCDVIHLLQAVRPTGRDTASGSRVLSFVEQHFERPLRRDAAQTAAGWSIDVPPDVTNPFYTSATYPAAHYVGMPGRSGDSVAVAFMRDAPKRVDRSYPPDIVTIVLDFEVCAVCTQGDGKGAVLGRYAWRWERPRGGPYVVTKLGGTQDGPSIEFGDALQLWRTLHDDFTLPMSSYPVVGGMPCPH